VENAVLSPDGTTLAIVKPEPENIGVGLWDLETGKLNLSVPDARVPFTWSPDSTKLVAATDFRSDLKIWDVSTGEEVKQLTDIDFAGYGISVDELDWSPNGNKVYGVGLWAEPYIWDTHSGELLSAPEDCNADWCGRYSTYQIEFSPDGKYVAEVGSNSESWGHYVTIYYAATGDYISEDQSSGYVLVAWKPDTMTLTGFTNSGTFHMQGSEAEPISHQPNVRALAWSPDGSKIASASGSWSFKQPIFIWDIEGINNQDLYDPLVVRWHGEYYRQLYWDDTGLASIGETPTKWAVYYNVYFWKDVLAKEQPQILFSFEGFASFAWNPSFTRRAVSNFHNSEMEITDVSSNEIIMKFDVLNPSNIEWSPDGSRIASFEHTYIDGKSMYLLKIWDDQTGRLMLTKQIESYDASFRWSPDSKTLLIGSYVGKQDSDGYSMKDLLLINPQTGEIRAIQEMTASYYDMLWRPDSRIFAVSIGSDNVEFRDGVTGELISRIETDYVGALAWSPDGRMLALGMSDGTIRIWDVADLMEQ
jgi:WD40 repeat protein